MLHGKRIIPGPKNVFPAQNIGAKAGEKRQEAVKTSGGQRLLKHPEAVKTSGMPGHAATCLFPAPPYALVGIALADQALHEVAGPSGPWPQL